MSEPDDQQELPAATNEVEHVTSERQAATTGNKASDATPPDPSQVKLPPAYPPAYEAGVFDAQARVSSDLPCWQCGYNLRTMPRGGACPECGQELEWTLIKRSQHFTRPFTMHTIPPASRTVGWVLGLIIPAFVVLFAAANPMDPVFVDWQSGRWEDYVGVMLAGRSMWAFYPFLIWGYVAFFAALIRPVSQGRLWWVRLGLICGVLLGFQYQVILLLSTGVGKEAVIAALFGGFGLFCLWGTVATLDAKSRPANRAQGGKRKPVSIAAQIIAPLVLLGLLFVTGIGALLAILGAPYLQAMCMLAMLIRIYRTDFDPPRQPIGPVPATLAGAGYAAAWPLAISQAQIVYSSLPLQPPHCYICTASANGHRWLTRPTHLLIDPLGNTLLVTRQMQTLKTAELMLAKRVPRVHRRCRSIYDRLGPPIAKRIRNPWLADLSYLAFTPIALAARLAFCCSADRQMTGPAYLDLSHPKLESRRKTQTS